MSALTVERSLALCLAIEIAIFALLGSNFVTLQNAGEIIRASAETGLLALALTPIILTGGIDLSVGSLLALCAVVFGMTWADAGWPIPLAAGAAIAAGLAGGALNALLVARLQVPPLIVTLGTFSLFRGIAEGATAGVRNYSNFPDAFLFLGQGAVGFIPSQFVILLAAAVAIWLLVHRMTVGRTLSAIGFSIDGARHAGLPVARRLSLVYVLSGLAAAVAALLYVARLGQAKADAGTGFELTAITAVVLGGTSIFGGRGSVRGTLLGLATLAVLQNGLRLSDLPAELAGVVTAVLLVAALGASRAFERDT
ncbi:MAG TPA: ABC transporter permease [Vicinamibacterales bacterium]|jgi:rhamnose transport system permease protein|nr:ABC transporter permease [Vicinamibacterales bacterium]